MHSRFLNDERASRIFFRTRPLAMNFVLMFAPVFSSPLFFSFPSCSSSILFFPLLFYASLPKRTGSNSLRELSIVDRVLSALFCLSQVYPAIQRQWRQIREVSRSLSVAACCKHNLTMSIRCSSNGHDANQWKCLHECLHQSRWF